jgi:hypothetical protein
VKAKENGQRCAEPVLKNGEDRRNEEKEQDLGSAHLEKGERSSETDRGEEGDHQRIAKRDIELKKDYPVLPSDEDDQRDQQAADNRGRDVVPGKRFDDAAQSITDEEDDPGKGKGMDEIEGKHD